MYYEDQYINVSMFENLYLIKQGDKRGRYILWGCHIVHLLQHQQQGVIQIDPDQRSTVHRLEQIEGQFGG